MTRIALVLSAGLLLLFSSPAPAAPQRPNIVILYADDLGYGDLAIQNPGSKIPTPSLDRLACEGIRFTDAHSSSGVCSSSRYALLTGRYHWRKFHGIVGPFGPPAFDPGQLTLAGMLKEKGYRTACIGKWHLGWDWESIKRQGAAPSEQTGYGADAFDWSRPVPGGPLSHGFDHYFGPDVPNFPPYTWIEDDAVQIAPTVPFAPDPVPAEGTAEGHPGPMVEGWKLDRAMPRLTEEAVKWIGRQKGTGRPFFLYLPWTAPHAPIVPTEPFRGTTSAGPYGDYIHQVDWSAGQVLKALDENGLRDETLVIFASDNGPALYAYDRVRNFGHRSMGPLRGLKADIWEGGHRVPLVIRWPGVVEPGRVSDALVSQIDLMATLAAVVGYELPDHAAPDSFDLLPLLRGDPGSESIRTSLVHNTFRDRYAIRRGDWVLIDAPSGTMRKVPEWFDELNGYEHDSNPAALYNLRDDIGQRTNLYAQNPAKVAELRALLGRIRRQGHSAPRLER